MGFQQIIAITKKNMQSLIKDRRTFGLLIFMPIFMMLIFGYGFGQGVKNIPIKVVNFDEGGTGIPPFFNDTYFSSIGIESLKKSESVRVSEIPIANFSLVNEKSKIYGGNNYYALIIFPENFTEDMPYPNREINLEILIDASEVQAAAAVQSSIVEMLNSISNAIGNTTHLKLNYDYVAGSPDFRPIDTLAPGILSFAILLFMILNVTGGFTKEKTTGTLYRVVAAKTSKADILLGYMLGNSIIALIQSSLLLTISVFLFNLHIVGSLLLLYLVLFIYALSCIGIGILAASFAKTDIQAFQFIPIILIPFMFFSGFIFPIDGFPEIFQWISVAIPMTYSINVSRAIMINGLGLGDVMFDFIMLLVLTALFLSIAILIFKPKK